MNDIKTLNHAADNIRILAVSAVEKAKSGHPGGAMGGADFINVLYSEYLQYDPENPKWEGRDRFFLDPGHMSPMLYAQLALAGKWTWDKFYEFSNAVGYNEDNGDNIPSSGDIFGFIIETGAIDCAFYSADLHMFSHDNTGGISVDESCFGLKADGFVADLNDFIHRSGSVYYTVPVSEGNDDANDTQNSSKWMFSRGEALFIFGRAIVARDVFSKAEGLRYGILPIPKYDEEQIDYGTTAHDSYTLMTVLDHANSNTPTKGGAVSAYLQLSTEESYTNVRGYYINKIVKPKYFGTDDSSGSVTKSIQIFNIIAQNVEFTFVSIYGPQLNGVINTCWRDAVTDGTTAKAAYEASQTAFDDALTSLDGWLLG